MAMNKKARGQKKANLNTAKKSAGKFTPGFVTRGKAKSLNKADKLEAQAGRKRGMGKAAKKKSAAKLRKRAG